ncbi:hypothetical protein Cgig2_011006 [Carnegiea gigantea]|uniref:Uncharacterized protein n=1 Tax=Carnegiea gigantea TaxID=171969 RepID=A0A9Q1KEI4_9CARY|nr:hypothetical protein Cgig2_011006 [Carnegiea gigantea]
MGLEICRLLYHYLQLHIPSLDFSYTLSSLFLSTQRQIVQLVHILLFNALCIQPHLKNSQNHRKREKVFGVAVEVAMEDDVFFADLNRQISLLIDDDDDDDPLPHPQIHFSQSTIHPSMLPSAQYIHQENCTKEYFMSAKGTGVFIPQWPLLRRKYKEQRKRRAKSNNNNKQFINSKGRSPES